MPKTRSSGIMAFFIVLLIPFCMLSQVPRTADWKSIEEAWKIYLSNPTTENANRINALLPDSKNIVNALDGALVITTITESIGTLESQIYSGERGAVQLGFHLYTIAYDTLTQALTRILGNFVRFNAKMFLEETGNQRAMIPDLAEILGSFRFDFPDEPASRELEKKLRIKALEAVEDKPLKSIRKECLKILKNLPT